MIDLNKTPKSQGYTFPAEWEEHEATWLSWPHKEESWPGKLEEIYPFTVNLLKFFQKTNS
jgi:agmatine deiminase